MEMTKSRDIGTDGMPEVELNGAEREQGKENVPENDNGAEKVVEVAAEAMVGKSESGRVEDEQRKQVHDDGPVVQGTSDSAKEDNVLKEDTLAKLETSEAVLPYADANGHLKHQAASKEADVKMELDESGPVDEAGVSPPPPPPPKAPYSVEHVDVDLGPLKSVSRNHAKIEYRTDLGHFCLEIYGRNGAWVDDRYYVKGSIVPLNQG